jgi:hypothetical protein
MLNSNELSALSADELWVLHNRIVEVLVARMIKRSLELDACLAELQPGSPPPTDTRQRKAA